MSDIAHLAGSNGNFAMAGHPAGQPRAGRIANHISTSSDERDIHSGGDIPL